MKQQNAQFNIAMIIWLGKCITTNMSFLECYNNNTAT